MNGWEIKMIYNNGKIEKTRVLTLQKEVEQKSQTDIVFYLEVSVMFIREKLNFMKYTKKFMSKLTLILVSVYTFVSLHLFTYLVSKYLILTFSIKIKESRDIKL